MFKVSEVAEMLSVETFKIFEALLVHDDVLEPYVTKERHLTYLSEVGVRKLEQILFGVIEMVPEVVPEEEEEIVIVEQDHLDQFIEKNLSRKLELRNELVDLKRQLNILDKELRSKDDAIINYQRLLSEDLKWLSKLENEILNIKVDTDDKKNGFFNRLMK